LSTVAQPLEHSSIVKEAKVEALKSIAKSLLGIDLLEVKIAKEKELQRELDREEEIELFENEITSSCRCLRIGERCTINLWGGQYNPYRSCYSI
jgi:hypothetical protein